MLTSQQVELLDSFIGQDGIYTRTILESNLINDGTKVLFLQRAMDCTCFEYNEYLGQLFVLRQNDAENHAWVELLRAFKFIHDIYWNNEVQYGEYGNRPALQHYFSRLGEASADVFRPAVRDSILRELQSFREGKEIEIAQEMQNRIHEETNLYSGQWWHAYIELPKEQRLAWFVRQPGFGNLPEAYQDYIALKPGIARAAFQALPLTMDFCQSLDAERFIYFIENWLAAGICKIEGANITLEHIAALTADQRTDLVQHHNTYAFIMLQCGKCLGHVPSLAELYTLPTEKRLFLGDYLNVTTGLILINAMQISYADFTALDMDVLQAIHQHSLYLFLLVHSEYLTPEKLLQLSPNLLHEVGAHFSAIDTLHKKANITLGDLLELPAENRGLMLQYPSVVSELISADSISRDHLLEFAVEELRMILEHPASDEAHDLLSRTSSAFGLGM